MPSDTQPSVIQLEALAQRISCGSKDRSAELPNTREFEVFARSAGFLRDNMFEGHGLNGNPSRDWRVAGKDVIHLAFNICDAMEKGSRSVNRTDTINLPFALLDFVQLISFHEVFAPGPLRIFQF